jgi:hypothetical protein
MAHGSAPEAYFSGAPLLYSPSLFVADDATNNNNSNSFSPLLSCGTFGWVDSLALPQTACDLSADDVVDTGSLIRNEYLPLVAPPATTTTTTADISTTDTAAGAYALTTDGSITSTSSPCCDDDDDDDESYFDDSSDFATDWDLNLSAIIPTDIYGISAIASSTNFDWHSLADNYSDVDDTDSCDDHHHHNHSHRALSSHTAAATNKIYKSKLYNDALTATITASTASSVTPAEQPRKRRVQVGRACASCRHSKTACAAARPCPRCIATGNADTCVDAPCKRRRKLNAPKRDEKAVLATSKAAQPKTVKPKAAPSTAAASRKRTSTTAAPSSKRRSPTVAATTAAATAAGSMLLKPTAPPLPCSSDILLHGANTDTLEYPSLMY